MHNHGSQGRKYAQPWIHRRRRVGVPSSDPWGPGLVGAAGRDSMQFPRWIPGDLVGVPSSDQRRPGQHDAIPCGPGLDAVPSMDPKGPGWSSIDGSHGGQHDAQPWIPGPEVCTTLDPWASMMHNHGSQGQKYADVCKHWVNVCRRVQTLGERRQTPGQHDAQPWIPGDLVGVPSMDPWGPGLDAQPWIPRDLVGVPSSDQRRPGQHDAIPCGPGLVGAAGRDSSAQPWIHGGQHDADVGKPGRLKESLSTVCTVPIGGDR